MSFLGLFKKGADVPPDVGKEVSESQVQNEEEAEEEEEDFEEKVSKKRGKSQKNEVTKNERASLDFQKVSAKVEVLGESIKENNERFSMLREQIGEIRAMNLSNEKSIAKVEAEASRSIDMVKEVEPDKLRTEYQKAHMKLTELSEQISSNKQFMDSILEEIKDIKRKMKDFLATEELLKINEDMKKDLMQTQKIASKAQINADKTEQLFSEMRRALSENSKTNEKIDNLDSTYGGLNKEIEKLKVDFSNIVKQGDFLEFKRSISSKLSLMESGIDQAIKMKESNERMERVVETILNISKQNKDDIASVALKVGDDGVQKVREYDEKIDSILHVLDTLANQITEVREKVGLKKKKHKIEVTNEVSSEPLGNSIELNEKAVGEEINRTEKVVKEMHSNEVHMPSISHRDNHKTIIHQTHHLTNTHQAHHASKNTKLKKADSSRENEKKIRELLSSSFAHADSASVGELKSRYSEVKKLYDSLAIKKKGLHHQIMEFYHLINKKIKKK